MIKYKSIRERNGEWKNGKYIITENKYTSKISVGAIVRNESSDLKSNIITFFTTRFK